MSASQGQFVWCELMTADTAAATAFYGKVIGWEAKDAGPAYGGYTILHAGETPVGGVMALPPGAQPGWVGYVAVNDVDAAAARVKSAGGQVHRAADDIPEVGRFAVVADPQGAVFTLFKPMTEGTPPPPAGATPGRVGWHELTTSDREAAFAFYAALFGWTKAEAHDMGPMGIYQIFAVGGVPVGGMFASKDRPPSWLYYFNVDAAEAAVSRVKAAGGELVNGPMQVPGGSWIAHCKDPQGAMFAVVGPQH